MLHQFQRKSTCEKKKETHLIASEMVEGQSNYHNVQDHQFSSFQMYDYFLTFCNKVHCAIHMVDG